MSERIQVVDVAQIYELWNELRLQRMTETWSVGSPFGSMMAYRCRRALPGALEKQEIRRAMQPLFDLLPPAR